MVTKNKTESAGFRACCAGISASLLVSIGMLMLISGFVISQRIGESSTNKLTAIVLLLSSLIGGMIARHRGGPKSQYVPAIVCGTYYCVLLIMGMLLFDGSLQFSWLSIGAVAVGCVLSYYLKFNKKRKHVKRR